MMELTVDLGARSYPIYIGRGLLEHAGAYLKRSGIGAGSPCSSSPMTGLRLTIWSP